MFKNGRGVIVLLFDVTLSTDVAFFETTQFSLPSIVISQGKEEDLFVYTLAPPIVSSEPALVPAPAQVKLPITQVYTRL